jgi:hypothetical protein
MRWIEKERKRDRERDREREREKEREKQTLYVSIIQKTFILLEH